MYFAHSRAVPPRPFSVQRAFGERVRALRHEQGLTQEDLAERCGLFRTYMSRIETGRANPTLTMIQALATSLRVPMATLFEGPPPATPRPRATPPPRPSRGRVR